jgi:1-acyl-sn-glycerol-3-phosphate acyltransferase
MSDAKFSAVDDTRPTGTERPRRTNAIDSAAPFLEQIDERLGFLERKQIRFVRKTFDSPVIDRGVRAMQRRFGAIWIEHALGNVRHVHGLERVGTFDPKKSYVCVANHRSFFDLYVITSYLVYRDMLPQRILFPVRSNFFYDNPLGLAVNGLMSFFAMYPPIFRDKKKADLNIAGLQEVIGLLKRGGFFLGMHPEGQRNQDGSPYELLPPKPGVGRIIHMAQPEVIPVFVNGLGNDFVAQIKGNFDRSASPVHVVFGKPLDMKSFYDRPATMGTFRDIASHCMEAVAELGQEEKAIRARG